MKKILLKTPTLLIIIGCCLLVASSQALSTAPVIILPLEKDNLKVSDAFFLEDTTQTLSIDAVTQPDFQPNFKPAASFLPPLLNNVYWLKFSVVNPSETDADWVLDFDSWTKVEFFSAEKGSNVFKRQVTGHLVPFKERDYPVANNNYIRLHIKGKEQKDCFVRLSTHYDYLVRPLHLSFKIQTELGQIKTESFLQKIIYLFFGVYLVMFMYNLFVYLSTNDKSYFYYQILLGIMVVIVFHNFGYWHQILSFIPSYHNWHGKVEIGISALLGIIVLLFVSNFLNVKEYLPRWQKIINILIVITALHPIPAFFGYTFFNYNLSSLLGITSFILVISLLVTAYRRGLPSSIYLLIAYSCFLSGVILYLAGELTGFWTSKFPSFIVQIGSTIEIILFSFALGNRINLLRKDNEEKQQLLIRQLKENQELQLKVNKELEIKVKERTAEIEKQKEEIQQEKEKSDHLLLNILPASTAEELKKKGFAESKRYENVSVLFTDFKEFTELTERLSPNELVEGLDVCFKAFDDIVDKYGLEKIKTIGDSYMCAGGLPLASETHAENAILAAIEMTRFVKQWSSQQVAQGKEPWKIRIGINSGEVITGVVGKKKFAFDIWGDTVNIASRMETHSEPGKINISESTYILTKDKFQFISRGKIEVKGKGVVDMYFVETL